jgi:hypothetical protein
MPDKWELDQGLLPKDPLDRHCDPDGDFVPNVWEWARDTAPKDATSKPDWDALVVPLPTAGSTPPEFSSLAQAQAHVETLSSSNDYRLVGVKRGTYTASLPPSTKRIAWVAQNGAEPQATVGPQSPEGVVLQAAPATTSAPQGLVLESESYLSGLIVQSDLVGNQLTMPAFQVRLPAGTSAPHAVTLANSLVRAWSPVASSNTAPGALDNNGAFVDLVHCTFWRSFAKFGTGHGSTLRNLSSSGSMTLINCLTADDRTHSGNLPITGQMSTVTQLADSPPTDVDAEPEHELRAVENQHVRIKLSTKGWLLHRSEAIGLGVKDPRVPSHDLLGQRRFTRCSTVLAAHR